MHALRVYQELGILPTQRDYRHTLIETAALYDALGDTAAAQRYRRMLPT